HLGGSLSKPRSRRRVPEVLRCSGPSAATRSLPRRKETLMTEPRTSLSLALVVAMTAVVHAQDVVSFPDLVLPGDVAIDVNGDGLLDCVAVSHDPGGLVVRLGHGNSTFGPETLIPGPMQAGALLFGDVNGDGVTDVVLSALEPDSSEMNFTVFA